MRKTVCTFLLVAALSASVSAAQAKYSPGLLKKKGVIFYAPFEGKYEPVVANGDAAPFVARYLYYAKEGKVGQCLHMKPRGKYSSTLIYHGLGNMYAERGSVAFWFRPTWRAGDHAILGGSSFTGPSILTVSTVEPAFYYGRCFLYMVRRKSFFQFIIPQPPGGFGDYQGLNYQEAIKNWKAGEWHHILFVWDKTKGVRFYDNGVPKFSSWGKARLVTRTPDKISFGRIVTNKVLGQGYEQFYDEFLVFDRPVTDAEIPDLMAARYDRLKDAGALRTTMPVDRSRADLYDMRPDPGRLAVAAKSLNGLPRVDLDVTMLDVASLYWKYSHADRFVDRDPTSGYALNESGVAVARTLSVALTEDAPFNYAVLLGRFTQGSYLPLAQGKRLAVQNRGPNGMRALLEKPVSQRQLTFLFEKRSRINELSFYRCRMGQESAQEGFEMRPLTRVKDTGRLGNLGHYLLRHFDPAERQVYVGGAVGALLAAPRPRAGQAPPLRRTGEAVSLAPLSIFNIAVGPFERDIGVGAFRLDLPVARPSGKPLVKVRVTHPFDRRRLYLDFDFVADLSKCRGRPVALISLSAAAPGMILPAGEVFHVEVLFDAKMSLLIGNKDIPARAGLKSAPIRELVPAFSRLELHALNDEFTSRMGLNRFQNPGESKEQNPLLRAFHRIFRYDPDNALARNLYRWARFEKWAPFTPPAPGPHPRWAVLARDTLKSVARQAHWWLDNRQTESGYVVGDADRWNDITKLFNKYNFLPLISDDRRLTSRMKQYLDAHWSNSWTYKGKKQYRMVKGYGYMFTDIVHSQEEASYLEPTMVLLRYGMPLHVERCLLTAKNLRTWTGVNKAGHRHYRTNYFNATHMRTEGRHGREVGMCMCTNTPAWYVLWYNDCPELKRMMIEMGDAILGHFYKADGKKPADTMPDSVDFETDRAFPSNSTYRVYYYHQLLTCYSLTGDAKYLKPIEVLLAKGDKVDPQWFRHFDMPILLWRMITNDARHDAQLMKQYAAARDSINNDSFYQRGLRSQELPCLLAWAITRKKEPLELALINALRNNVRAMPAYTIMDPDTDRVYPWGRWVLPMMYCGGMALNERGSGPYPHIAIAWERTGMDFAALVMDWSSGPGQRAPVGQTLLSAGSGVSRRQAGMPAPPHLRRLVYGFGDEDRTVIMRNYGLAPGTYILKQGDDLNRDDQMDSVKKTRRVVLRRMTPVEVTLPARRVAVIELEQVQASEPAGLLADLAIDSQDIQVLGKGPVPSNAVGERRTPCVIVSVHNIGMADAGRFDVIVSDGAGEVLGKTTVKALKAPLDLEKKVVKVCVPLRALDADRAFVVTVDREDAVPEINEQNNAQRVAQPVPSEAD